MGYNPSSFTVLMTADTVGGVWNYCMELCRSLQQHVFFHLVTAGAPLQPAQAAEAASLPNVAVYETTYKLEWMEDAWEDVDASGAWLLDLAERLQPDLIHLNSYAHAALPFAAPKIVVAHSDVVSWWWAVKGEAPGQQWEVYRSRVREGLASADWVVGLTTASLEQMFRLYGVRNLHRVLHNGRDAGLFKQGEKLPVVLTMGRMWDEAKNVQLLVKAAPHIHCPVQVAGDLAFGANNHSLQTGAVQYLGRLDAAQVADALAHAAVFALPARYEPFGLAALEAALCGCALVLGDTPTLRELWGDAACYVNPDDALGLASTINQLIANEPLHKEMAARAATRARNFSVEKMASGYLQLYRDCIRQTTLIPKETA